MVAGVFYSLLLLTGSRLGGRDDSAKSRMAAPSQGWQRQVKDGSAKSGMAAPSQGWQRQVKDGSAKSRMAAPSQGWQR